MKIIRLVFVLLILTPSISYGFKFQGFTPFPNYSNYTKGDVNKIVYGIKKIKHRVKNFIGWKNTAFFYLDIVSIVSTKGAICINSLKREAGKIGWPLELLVIETEGSHLKIVSKIKFSDKYEELINGSEQKKVCSSVVDITKNTKLAVIPSAKYTFIGKIEIKTGGDEILNLPQYDSQKIYNTDISSFLFDYRRKLNIAFENYFDDLSLSEKENAKSFSSNTANVLIWNKPLDEIFRRNSRPINDSKQIDIYQAQGQLIEVAFGIRNNKVPNTSCVLPVIISEGAQIGSVKSYEYVGVTGKGKIAEKLVLSDRKIQIDSDAKEVILNINQNTANNIKINFVNCENKVLVKSFDIFVKRLPTTNIKIPVLVWPYQKFWPKALSSQVFDDLISHHSNIAALSGYYVPRLNKSVFDTVKFNQFRKQIPVGIDLFLFPHLQNDTWRLKHPGFKKESHAWVINQQHWANQLNLLVQNLERTVYLTLLDEPRNKRHFTIANRYYDFFKDRPDNLKILTTLSSGMSVATIFKTASVTDILVLEQSLVNDLYLKTAKLTGKDVWLYSSRQVGRNRDPLKDYRFLAWKVYVNELQGIGIWNYSSNKMGTEKISPMDYDISGSNYGLVYIEDEKVFSSKRWEAFKRGMEDIMIAKSMESKFDKDVIDKIFIDTMQNNKNAVYLRKSLYQLLKY